ncbi:MAG: YceD family protein [Oscillospiraceae bacterium]
MFLPVRRLLRETGDPLVFASQVNFSQKDFPGYTLPEAVAFTVTATPDNGRVLVHVSVLALVCAPCARCLPPVRQPLQFEKEYVLREADFAEEFPELPLTPEGLLDAEEMVYQELLLEAPGVLLCSEDCQGLCAACGNLKQECTCEKTAEGDPRLQVLRQLLQQE